MNTIEWNFLRGTGMDVQTAEHPINPSEEVIGLGPLSVHFLITGDNSLGSVAAFN